MDRSRYLREFVVILTFAIALGLVVGDQTKPTLYNYYKGSGISTGLKTTPNEFILNGKAISLFSGSIHYFRVHPMYWRDRLRKLRAAGFVAVETYVPWNLHEPQSGVFDFGDGGNDMSPFLDVKHFLELAMQEDLLAIVRPGPYICAEWEFGGLPSWLLRDPEMRMRTSDERFMSRVERYFSKLLPFLRDLQFSSGKGPIIAFQIENEYGNTKVENVEPDKKYLEDIKNIFEANGLNELFFTSDTPSVGREWGALPGVLQTANFNEGVTKQLTLLKEFQKDQPAMVMEFWTGWFDHWGEAHHTVSTKTFTSTLEEILQFPSGVNFYMFHGGTSFGFLNGANIMDNFPYYMPDISSYDYNAPLSESGDYTAKYNATRALLARYQKVDLALPDLPPETEKIAYEPLTPKGFVSWEEMITQVPVADKESSDQPKFMEHLAVNSGNGQSYGYVVYRKRGLTLRAGSKLEIRGKVSGAGMVLVDGERRSKVLETAEDLKGFGYWCSDDTSNMLDLKVNTDLNATLDIVVENWGRNNFGKLANDFNQVRGLTKDQVVVDGQLISGFDIYALQFSGRWVRSLKWKDIKENVPVGPLLLRFDLNVSEPKDTFLDMRSWGKGLVFINGFSLGRYSSLGPQRTLFAPAPLFSMGQNQIVVFEHYNPANSLKFSKTIIFENSDRVLDVKLF